MSEQIQKLETLFGMEEGSISKAVAGEDVSIDFDKVRSSADFETFKTKIEPSAVDLMYCYCEATLMRYVHTSNVMPLKTIYSHLHLLSFSSYSLR